MNIGLRSRGGSRLSRNGRTRITVALAATALMAGPALAASSATAVPPPKPPKTVNFSSATYQLTEGQDTGCVSVVRSVTKGKSPSVTVATSGGTATAGVDYTPVSSTVSFPRRQAAVSVCVPILVDQVLGESDETVTLTLSTSSRGWTAATPATATLTISEMAVPSAPTTLAADVVSGSVEVPYVALTWTAPSAGPVDHYVVFSALAAVGPWTTLGTTTGTNYDVTPAPAVDTYYMVEAVNADGAYSDDSNVAFGEGYVPGSGLYWANFFGGKIMAANRDGSGVNTLVSGQENPLGVAVDASYVYWTDYGAGTIMRADLDGTDVTTLVSGQDFPYGVAVDASHLYWTNLGDDTINVADLDGTNVTTLISGEYEPSAVAVDGNYIYWTSWGSPGGMIKRADLNGDNVTTLVTDQDYPFALAVDGNFIYWVNQGEINYATGTVMRASLTGSNVTTLATGQWHPDGIAVDPGHVYWANSQSGTINAAELDGSNPTTLVTGTNQPAGVAVARP